MFIRNPNHIKNLLILFAIIFGILGVVNAQKMGEISDEEWNLVPPEGYENSPAIIIFDRGEVVGDNKLKFKITRHWRSKIIDAEKASDIITVDIKVYEGMKIKKLKLSPSYLTAQSIR